MNQDKPLIEAPWWAKRIHELEQAIEKIQHAAANAQEWYHADPDECGQLDRDSQIEAWFERLFDAIKSASAQEYKKE